MWEKLNKGYVHLKQKWGIKRDIDLLLILLVFAVTGSSVLKVGDWLLGWTGLKEELPRSLYIIVYAVLIFPVYQVLLLAFGFIFGQFHFFWEKEKKLLKLIGRLWRKK